MTMEILHIPESIAAAARKAFPDEAILSAVFSDLTHDRKHFGYEWLIITEKSMGVFSSTEKETSLLYGTTIKQLRQIDIVSHVGICFIKVEDLQGDFREIISFTEGKKGLFGHAVACLKKMIKDEPVPEINKKVEHLHCPSCGKPIPEEMNKCPRCMDRKTTLRRIAHFSRPYRGKIAGLLGCMLLATLCGLVTPYMSKLFIDVILKPDPVSGVFPFSHWLIPASLLLLAAYAMQLFWGGLQERLSGSLGFATVADVRACVFEKLQALSLSFFDQHQTGTLITRVSQDTSELQRLLVDFLPITLESVMMFFSIGCFLFILSWKLTLFVFIPILAIIYFVKYVLPQLWDYMHRYFHRRSRLTARISDSLSGVRVIKAFGQEDLEVDKFVQTSNEFRNAGIDLVKKWSIFHPTFHFFIMSGLVIVWLVGGHLVFTGSMSIGSVVAYSGYLMMFYRPVFILTRMIDLLTNALSAAERVFDIIDLEPEIQDAPDAVSIPEIKGKIIFDHVTFGYDRFKAVIKDMDLTIEPCETIGLVGKSGAGKSTFINLVCRLYDVNEGAILIDDTDVRKIKQRDMRSQIGIVLQDTFLFNGTIFENIVYAKPNATRDEVIEASMAANAHGFILKKADGYDTEVGERGNRLSGGEKQRIAIARAILRDPRILILDEATSSVDTETEKKIQEALERLMQGRTTIAIAHRLSTLRRCNRLFVIENGAIVEMGTHQELLDRKGRFHELIAIQREMSELIAVGTES